MKLNKPGHRPKPRKSGLDHPIGFHVRSHQAVDGYDGFVRSFKEQGFTVPALLAPAGALLGGFLAFKDGYSLAGAAAGLLVGGVVGIGIRALGSTSRRGELADQKFAERLDNRVLREQRTLIQESQDGGLSEEVFVSRALSLEELHKRGAQARVGGITTTEKQWILGDIQSEERADPQLKTLYADLASGETPPKEALEQLSWRSLRAYGGEVKDREGPVYADERYKLRAALNDDTVKPGVKRNYDGPYHPKLDVLLGRAMELFPKLDRDQDRVIDRLEARQILVQHQELGLSPAEAATLYSEHATLAQVLQPAWSGERLARRDLEAALSENRPKNPGLGLKKILTRLSQRIRQQEAYHPEPDPFYRSPDGPNPLNVRQKSEGSCWLLAPLASMNTEQLERVIQPEASGARVTLADGRSTYVEPLNEAERRVYSSGDGAWSGLLEKGTSQILGRKGQDINSGFVEVGGEMLAGGKHEKLSLSLPPSGSGPDCRDVETLARVVEEALNSNQALYATTRATDFERGVSKLSASNHAYTILSTTPDGTGVRVRNPWGRGESADRDGVDDGQFELSWTELVANFSYLIRRSPGE